MGQGVAGWWGGRDPRPEKRGRLNEGHGGGLAFGALDVWSAVQPDTTGGQVVEVAMKKEW